MRLYFLILFLLITNVIISQVPLFNPINFSKNYSFNTIDQDSYGFLWLGSSSGLVFYNGFEDYLLQPHIINSAVHSVQIQNDTLYAGTETGKVYLIDLKERHVIDSIILNIELRISDIKCSNHKVYISTYGKGLFEWNKNHKTFRTLNLNLSSKHIYELLELSSERLAICSDRGIDLVNLNELTSSSIPGLPDIIVTNLEFEYPNWLWATSYDQSLFRVNLENNSIQDFPFDENQRVFDFIIFQGKKVISTTKGVKYLSELNGEWYNNFNQNLDQKYHALMVDQENNMWLVNDNNPVWKASLYFSVLDSYNINEIQALEHIHSGLLIGNKEGLFSVGYENGAYKKVLNNNITCIDRSDHLLVVGTFSSGIYILNHNLNLLKRISHKEGLKDNSILDIELSPDGSIICSTLSGTAVISISEDGNSIKIVDIKGLHQDLDYSYIMDVYCSSQGIFLGKDKAGFSIIKNGNLRDFKYLNNSKKKLGSINSIAETEDGAIWLSSSNLGLLKYAHDSLRQIQSIRFDEDPYTSIIPISNNNLLLIRSSSIDLFNVQKEHIMYFNEEAKLIPEEPFINNYTYGSDNIWFVHHDKIYSFNPPTTFQKIHPTTSIDLLEVNLEPVPFHKTQFNQSENNFKFSFTGGWLTDPSKLSYSYYLDGYDKEWRNTKDRSVNYPHLPPGNYIFNVKAAENEYFSDEPITKYSFKVKQSFYRSNWFYLILFLLAAYLINFLRLRHQREKDLKAQLNQRQIETQLINLKAQLNPHFLFNSFNTLSGLIEENPENGVRYIENITDFYRYILELGDQKLISLSTEMELVELYKKLIKERFGEGFKITSHIINGAVLIPPMTIQMLIENAIKHNQLSKKNPLKIEILQNESHIEITNNKILKNISVPGTGLGLKNISDRYRLLGLGKIVVEDSINYFKVFLPNTKKPIHESINS